MSAQSDQNRPRHSVLIFCIRALILSAAAATIRYNDVIQGAVDHVWAWLRGQWVYNSVYFETWLLTFSYAVLIPLSFFQTLVKSLEKYKMGKDVQYVDAGIITIVKEAIIYVSPLMLMDTFTVKRYCWVDPEEWTERRKSWIQHTRALPLAAPSVFQIVSHLVLSMIVYDFLFFAIHYAMHKSAWLYKHVHAKHHQHTYQNCRVTNQATVTERIALILAANESLKLVGAHPFTRSLFIILFISWLIEDHSGYDMPWSLDKVVPFGLVGGAKAHYAHHKYGNRCYQPYFTYIDKYLISRKSKQ